MLKTAECMRARVNMAENRNLLACNIAANQTLTALENSIDPVKFDGLVLRLDYLVYPYVLLLALAITGK